MLKPLEADGLVRGRWIAQADRPDKRLFALTDAGTETLRARSGRGALLRWLEGRVAR